MSTSPAKGDVTCDLLIARQFVTYAVRHDFAQADHFFSSCEMAINREVHPGHN